MPRGRKPSHDAKIARLIKDLHRAIVARETAKIETAVSHHISGLVDRIQAGVEIGGASQPTNISLITTPETAAPATKKGRRRKRSVASRALQAKRMRAYWAARKAKEARKAPLAKARGGGNKVGG